MLGAAIVILIQGVKRPSYITGHGCPITWICLKF